VDWLERYWWAIFGVAGATAYIAWKMRDRPAKEPFLLRLIYTLAPVLDKDSPERRQVTPLSLVLVAVGLLLVLLANLLVSVVEMTCLPKAIQPTGSVQRTLRRRGPCQGRAPFECQSRPKAVTPNPSLKAPTRYGSHRLAAPGLSEYHPSAASLRLPPRSA